MKGQGVKPDVYWIHKQLNQPFSSLTYSASILCCERFHSLFGSSYLSTIAIRRAPSYHVDALSSLTLIHGCLPQSLLTGGQCPAKGDPLSGIWLRRRAAVTQPLASLGSSHFSCIVVVPPSRLPAEIQSYTELLRGQNKAASWVTTSSPGWKLHTFSSTSVQMRA